MVLLWIVEGCARRLRGGRGVCRGLAGCPICFAVQQMRDAHPCPSDEIAFHGSKRGRGIGQPIALLVCRGEADILLSHMEFLFLVQLATAFFLRTGVSIRRAQHKRGLIASDGTFMASRSFFFLSSCAVLARGITGCGSTPCHQCCLFSFAVQWSPSTACHSTRF